ncbi:MAG: mechanosensitive ion channel family protein [Culturomica sp.]|jgi:small conductance mechanosensitive channel|nr:mechanosensitive ion channel family protein [Culturomica sp.]
MKKILPVFLFFFLFAGVFWTGCKQPSGRKASENRQAKNEFLISDKQVGVITKGMSIRDLYGILPAKNIKKIKTKADVAADADDTYYIYGNDKKLLFIINTARENDLRSGINRIDVKDKRFVTEKGVGLASSVGEIRKAYDPIDFIPTANEIVLFIPEIDANFEISKNSLPGTVWNDSTGVVDNNVPDSTAITALTVFWTHPQESVVSRTFWHDLFYKFLDWCKTELPSIAILVLFFMGALYLLKIITGRINKVAANRAKRSLNADHIETQKRIKTLAGVISSIGKIILWVIFLLILLSKFNINIAPILASAGIVGLAVGFGAQELVRDFISGFFILLENQIRTGDTAIINGTVGTVEDIEMRTITLRDTSGVVHIFQNGKIDTLSNMTKGWSAIIVEIGVNYKEEVDTVTNFLKEIGDELLNDSDFTPRMLGSVEVWSIDQFGENAMILKVKITTKAGEQWGVAREFRRRVKKTFDAHNIDLKTPRNPVYNIQILNSDPAKPPVP